MYIYKSQSQQFAASFWPRSPLSIPPGRHPCPSLQQLPVKAVGSWTHYSRWIDDTRIGSVVQTKNHKIFPRYSYIIMGAMASQITSLTIVYSTVYSGADQRKHQSSALLAFVVTGEFPAQMASNAENNSIWWSHHYIDDNFPTSSMWFIICERLQDFDYSCMLQIYALFFFIAQIIIATRTSTVFCLTI